MINRQTATHCFFLVVLSLHQRFTGYVVEAFLFWCVVDDVIGPARGKMGASATDSFDDFVVINRDFQNGIDMNTVFFQRVSLRYGARETVKQKPGIAVILGDAFLNQPHNQIVGYQFPYVHHFFCSHAQRCSFAYGAT